MKLWVLATKNGYFAAYDRYRNTVHTTADITQAMLFSSPTHQHLRRMERLCAPDASIVQIDFTPEKIIPNMKEAPSMKSESLAHSPNLKVVGCVFTKPTEGNLRGEIPSERVYYYEVIPGLPELAVGDTVVVVCATGWQVVDVAEVDVTDPEKIARATARVVAWVNTQPYNEHCAKLRRITTVKRKMQLLSKKLEGEALYELMAKMDPRMADLLQEFKALGSEFTE